VAHPTVSSMFCAKVTGLANHDDATQRAISPSDLKCSVADQRGLVTMPALTDSTVHVLAGGGVL
jgi:hypothetical protein